MEKTERNIAEAKTILEQIGGNRFIAMVGGYGIGANVHDNGNTEVFIRFKGSKKSNLLRIILDGGTDTYTMKFQKFSMKKGIKDIHTHVNVYCDMLQRIFTLETGLNTSL